MTKEKWTAIMSSAGLAKKICGGGMGSSSGRHLRSTRRFWSICIFRRKRFARSGKGVCGNHRLQDSSLSIASPLVSQERPNATIVMPSSQNTRSYSFAIMTRLGITFRGIIKKMHASMV